MRRLTLAGIALMLCIGSEALAQPQAATPQLFYLKKIEGGRALCSSAPLGGEQKTIRRFRETIGAQWSPNGQFLTFIQAGAAAGQETLFIVDCLTGQATSVNEPAQRLLGFSWSERSDRLFFFSGDPNSQAYDLWTRTTAPDAKPVRINGDLKALAVVPMSSPDGKWVVFAAADPAHPKQLAIADVTTGQARMVSGDLLVESHQWCPVGARLTFIARTAEKACPGLYVVDPTGEPRMVSLEGQLVRGFSWQPTGNLLAYLVGIGSVENVVDPDGKTVQVKQMRAWLYIAPMAGGAPERANEVADAVRFRWSPNGQYYVITDQAHSQDETVATLRVGGLDGPLRLPMLVRNSVGVDLEVWSPDSTKLLFRQGGAFYVFEPSTLQSRLLINNWPVRNLTWSPKSNALLIITPYEKGGNLAWRVDPATGMGTVISNAFAQGAVDWSPDANAVMLMMPTSEDLGTLYGLDANAATPLDPERAKLADDVLTATWYPKE